MIERLKQEDYAEDFVDKLLLDGFNRIIDGLNAIDKKLNRTVCTCSDDPTALARDCPVHGGY